MTARVARAKGELFGLDQRVYDAVFQAVMANRLAPGTKLVESVLCGTLDVPRAVVRAGMSRLAQDRIVELRPNRGAVVASPSLEEAMQVYDARRTIECAVVAQLAGRVTKRQLAPLRAGIDAAQAAFERGETAHWIRLAGEFHVALAGLSGNEVLRDIVRGLVSRSNLITALYLRPGQTVFSGALRLQLLDALHRVPADGSPDAPALMDGLLEGIRRRLRIEPHPTRRVDPSMLREVALAEG